MNLTVNPTVLVLRRILDAQIATTMMLLIILIPALSAFSVEGLVHSSQSKQPPISDLKYDSDSA